MHLMTLFLGLIFTISTLANPRDQLQVLTIEEPPFNFTNRAGELDGISVDAVKAIGHELGESVDIEQIPWVRAYQMAETLPGVVLFTAARIQERESSFYWIMPVVQNSWGFFSLPENQKTITSLQQLKNERAIGVLRGGAREAYLKRHGFNNLVAATTYLQLKKMLLKGRISMFFFAKSGLMELDADKESAVCVASSYEIVPPPSYIIMSKVTDAETVKRWRYAAATIRSNGTYKAIAEKWARQLSNECGATAVYRNGLLDFSNQ